MPSTKPLKSFKGTYSSTSLQSDPSLHEPKTTTVTALRTAIQHPGTFVVFAIRLCSSQFALEIQQSHIGQCKVATMDRASTETPRDGATLSTASLEANSLAVAVNVCPSPVVKRKRMGLWESIIIEEAKKKARIAAAAECAQKPTATFTSEEESAGEEASCSSEVDLPEQQATASDGDRQDEGKPMGTPLNEPLVGEDGKQFHPILEFLAYHAKVKVECARHGVFVVPSPCVVYRRRSVDDVPEHKVAKTS